MKVKIYVMMLVLFMFNITYALAQQKTISGTVSDNSGQPLPGVNILVKGTSTGTQTDFDGNYSINTSTGSILSFSYVGFITIEQTVGASTTLNVTMQDDVSQLDEVIVIGYGSVSQRDLTTNISKVEASEVQSISTANLAGALQGRASGVQVSQSSGAPGGEVRIRIRGSSSINGSNSPLYVIDGVPMFSGSTVSNSFGGQQNSALSNLNFDDIESINILKDAASSAIYGDRGSNGVVIITTKRGKTGKAKFNFSSTIGFQNAQDKYETLNFGEWLKFGDAYYENSGFGSGFWSSLWTGESNNNLSQGELDTYYNSVADQGDDYIDRIYVDDAVVSNVNFNVSGGNEDTKYYFGVSEFKQEGVLLNQNFERRNVRLNLNQKLTDKLKFTGGISLTDEESRIVEGDNNIFGVLSTAILEAPGKNIRNEDGTFNATEYTFSNPVQSAEEDLNLTSTFRILANADLQYNIANNLFLNSSIGFDQLNFRERLYNPPTSAQGAPLGFAVERKNEFRRIKLLQSINYNPKINDNIRLRTFLAAEWERSTSNRLGASSNGFTSPELKFLSEGATPLSATSSFSEEKRVSVISRLGATFYNNIIVEFSLRADASSKFGVENRWGFFPAASLGYIISEEDWFKTDMFNYLKLRGSWGVTGNTTAVGRFQSQPSVSSNTYGNTGTSFLTQANANITWEETSQYDLGFETKLLNNRVTLNYAYFNKKTKDNSLVLNVPNALSQGNNLIPQNVGEIVNKGHEIDLGIDVFKSEKVNGFNWTTNIGITTLDNEVTSLGGTSPFDTGFVSRVEEGASLGAFRVLITDGLYQNISEVPANLQAQGVAAGDVKYIDQNNDGLLNDEDFVIIGKPWADYTINWQNNLSFKNFDLSFLWALSEGNDVWNNNLQFAGSSSNRIFNKFKSQLNYWTPTNTDTNLPRPNLNTQGYNNQDGSRFLEDGSYIKLRNVTLGYTFNKIKGLDKVRVYVSADNLILITDYSGIDPEVNFNGAPGVTGGTDFLTQGANKVWKFGINVSF